MKVTISHRQVYHKIAVVEIEIDDDAYEHYKIDNGKYTTLDDFLQENSHLYDDKLNYAMEKAEFEGGFGCYGTGFDDTEEDYEYRYDCKELNTGGHL